jgi:hypothetical protein
VVAWFKRNWHLALYAATALNYAILLYVPYWIGQKLGCKVYYPDLNPFFSAQDFDGLRTCLSGQGGAGKNLFGTAHTFGADLGFPILFASSLIVLTLRAAHQSPRFAKYAASSRLAIISFMPIAYAVSDYAENMLVWRWLGTNPAIAATGSISVATALKFSFLAVALAGLAMFVLAGVRSKRKK